VEKIQLGLIVGASERPQESLQRVAQLGFPTCQLSATAERVVECLRPQQIRAAASDAGVRVSSFFLVFEGQIFNLKDGPSTMGLVAEAHRHKRADLFKQSSDKIRQMGVDSITSHIGFIPDDADDPVYTGFVEVMRDVAAYCASNGQVVCFETGQELPSTLKRTILDVGTGNLFVNLDPANLILYGKADPLDAAEIFGEYVRGMHAKDGVWPNRDEVLGHETVLGEGRVRFHLLIPRLKAKGFRGPITIEREISGSQQEIDILKAKALLDPYLGL